MAFTRSGVRSPLSPPLKKQLRLLLSVSAGAPLPRGRHGHRAWSGPDGPENHSTFEAQAIPLLVAVKQRDAAPVFDPQLGMSTSMFLRLQYMRTPEMKRRGSNAEAAGLRHAGRVASSVCRSRRRVWSTETSRT
jgi:hypothetical protein